MRALFRDATLSPLQIVLSKLESRVIPEPPHWNSEAWRQVIHGPALALCQSAQAAGLPANRCASMVEAYLSMAREAVILGWLMPAGVERISFFQTAWTELIPRLLPQAHPDLHGVILGTLWTLADNLMDVPPWLELLIVHASKALDDLEIVEAWVEDLILTALEPPAADLYGGSPEPCWVDLSEVDWRFLPGSVQFVSPTVAWVGDRARRDGLKRPLGIGLWLPPSGPSSRQWSVSPVSSASLQHSVSAPSIGRPWRRDQRVSPSRS